MSALPHNDTQQPSVLLGSVQTVASRPPASSRDPSTSKRVCFYKSGDLQFSGHRLVINSRTFKTFDALLDALSKKVPLPFGVRTITTPKGTHTVQKLDDLQDGASYVCSDQRKVKPLNLEEVNRRQVPWNTTRPSSAGRQGRRGLIRQLVKKKEVSRTIKVVETTVAVWTPKRLVVFNNRDPIAKRTIVLQRRTAPTFESLLDYLSQVLQFPVVKLYTADGRRVEGLPALILCSGIVVAAGNESFRLANYNLQGSSQPSQTIISESIAPAKTQPLPYKKQSAGSRPRSRIFSSSSERYFVDQINKSLNGSLSEDNNQKTGLMDAQNIQPQESEDMETSDCIAGIEEREHFIMPSEDDIEKSFRVNQDGSMTVEMKVHLTIKQEEMIHWTTTLSRTCTNSQQRAVYSQPVSSDNNNYPVREANGDSYEFKEDNAPSDKSVELNGQKHAKRVSTTSEALVKPKPTFQRLPTPGPRRVRRKETSVESIKRVSQNEVQESTVGAYSYMEHTAEGELTEGYCVVSRSSSSSTRPAPKPRKNSSGEPKHKKTHSSIRSSRMAEVLQLQNNGTEITETVMHIYESQGTYENYVANTQVTGDKKVDFRGKTKESRKSDSTDSGPRSSSNDCDVDLTRQSTSSDSQNTRKNELLSLSSGQSSHPQKASNNQSSCTNNEKQARPESLHKQVEDLNKCTKENSKDKTFNIRKTKTTQKSLKPKENNSSDTTASDKKHKDHVAGSLKDLRKSSETQSQTEPEKKIVSSAESDNHKQKSKKKMKDGLQKHQSPNLNSGDHIESPEKDLNLDEAATQRSHKKKNIHSGTPRDLRQNVNACRTDTLKSPIKKKLLDVVPPVHSTSFKTLAKQRTMSEGRTKSPKDNKELNESISMPVFHSPPCNVHQYVENWLNRIQPESVPYVDEMDPQEAEPDPEPRPQFWIGSGSAESSEIRSEPEKDSRVKECASLEATTTERPVSRPPVQIRCEGELVQPQMTRGFCKSMPSVRIHPAEQESCMRINKSSVALVPIQPDTESEASQSTKVNTRSGMKPVLEQLCLSIQSIRRTSSDSGLNSLEKEKSSSLPDFSSQVASVFGSPSKAFLSFLSLMTLKDGTSSTGNETSGSYPEALQVMQSLEKIASIEDEEELKASLTSLQSSTSSQLKKNWRDFQEKNDMEGSPPLSPRLSEQEFALEVDSEGEDQDKQQPFGIKELMDELNVSEDLRREISCLVDGGMDCSERTKLTKHSTETSENDATKDDFLEGEESSKESESEQLHRVDSCPPEQALLSKDQKSVIVESVPTTVGETNQTDVSAIEERYTENETCQVDKLDVQDQQQMNLEKKNGQENDKNEQESEHAEAVEADLHTHMSETDTKGLSGLHSEVNDDQDKDSEKGGGHDVNAEEEDTYQESKEYNEQLGIISVGAEREDIKAPTSVAEHDEFNRQEHELNEDQDVAHQNNAVLKEEDFNLSENVNKSDKEEEHKDAESHKNPALNSLSNENDICVTEEEENAKDVIEATLHALECSADDADIDTNVDPNEENDVNEDKVSKTLERQNTDAASHQSSISDQESKQSDINKAESEGEHELQASEEENVIKKQIQLAEEKDRDTDEREDKQSSALESEEDFDVEECPALSDQDKTQSCKSQESESDHELQVLKEENVPEKQAVSTGEEDLVTNEQEDKQSDAFNSAEESDAEANYPLGLDEDGEQSEQDKTQSQGSDTEFELKQEEDEHNKHGNAISSDKDFDAESNSPEMSDQNGLQILQEVTSTKKLNISTGEKSEAADEYKQSYSLDSDDDFDSEPNYAATYKDKEHSGTPKEENVDEGKDEEEDEHDDKDFSEEADSPAVSDRENELSDESKTKSCKSQQSEAECELGTPEESNAIKGKDEYEDKLSSALESEADSPAVSDQEAELSDQTNTRSCKSPKSEAEHEFGTSEEGNITEEKDEHEDKLSSALDSDTDFSEEADYPSESEQQDEVSDEAKARSCKSQQSEAEHELGTPESENVTKGKDEHEDKLSSALESEADSPALSDQEAELSVQTKTRFCKSRKSEADYDFGTPEEDNVTEEKDGHEDKLSSALDSENDFSDEADSASSKEDDKISDQAKTVFCKSQESEAKHEHRAPNEEYATEGKDEHKDKLSHALDSEFSAEADDPAVQDQEDKHSDARSYISQESKAEYELQEKEQGSNTVKQTSSVEEKDDESDEHVEKWSNALDYNRDTGAQTGNSYMPDPETKHTVKKESYKSKETRTHKSFSEDTVGVKEADAGHSCPLLHPMEISQDLLDFVNLALLSSALTFTYDSNGHLRIEPDRCKIREMPLPKSTTDNQCGQRCLPSPNTSDLSDYRPETSYSGGNVSHVSTDICTETEEEETEKFSINQCKMKQSSKNNKRHKPLDKNSRKDTKPIASPSLKSTHSLAYVPDCMFNGTTYEQTNCNTSSSCNEDSEPVVFHSEADSGEGILIDKGRWLLKENHLIRKSPPIAIGMYENADTTSADTAQDNTSEDVLCPPSGTQHSPLAVISSSELEEMAKPSTPKCTYFSMPHSSDSDPFLDNQSISSHKERGDVRKSRELKVCPMGETSKTLTKKNGSLPSFASVEFKLPDGKVHPEGELECGDVGKAAGSQNIRSRPVQEEEAVEELNLRCGRHCPIL